MAAGFDTEEGLHEVFGCSVDELADLVIDGFLARHPRSRSSTLPRSQLRTWTGEELDELLRVLRGDEVVPRGNLIYFGDVVENVEPAFAPLENFIEGKAIVARVLVERIWREHAGEPRLQQELAAALEDATLEIVRANMHYYADNCLGTGCFLRHWREEIDVRAAESSTHARGEGLTGREVQVMELAAQGLSNGEIAAQLDVARNTVKNHLAALYAKTGTANRTELARWAMTRDLLG